MRKILIILMSLISSFAIAQENEIKIASSGPMQGGAIFDVINKASVKLQFSYNNINSDLIISEYNFINDTKTEYSKVLTQYEFNSNSSKKVLLTLGEQNDNAILSIVAIGDNITSIPIKFNNTIKIIPINIKNIIYNKTIPIALLIDSNMTLNSNEIERFKSIDDINKISTKDKEYIKSNSSIFTIITYKISH